MKYFGKCPASCGEIFQGFIGEDEFLLSYAVPLYSNAELIVEENIQVIEKSNVKIFERKLKKVELAKWKTLEYYGVPKKDIENIKIIIDSQIPIGKGLSSSTADIGATIGACCAFLGKEVEPDIATQIALSIEATNTNFHKNSMVFSPVSGARKEELGIIEKTKVMILLPEGRVNTQELRMRENYTQIKRKNDAGVLKCYQDTLTAFQTKNYAKLGEVGIESALLNESLIKKMFLNEIIEIALINNTYGINVAHSGTAIGILMREDYCEEKLLNDLEENKVLEFYNTHMTMPIVEGGITCETK